MSKWPLEIIHTSDIWGPAQTPILILNTYYITFVDDDYSRLMWIYFLKEKSSLLSRLLQKRNMGLGLNV